MRTATVISYRGCACRRPSPARAAARISILALIGWLGLGLGLGLVASGAQGADAEKAITLIDDRPIPALEVVVEALQPSYRVNQSIRFRVTGNRPFYLYLYSIDQHSGNALLLLPNRLQANNLYPAGRSHLVPDQSVEFYADQPAIERVIMVASTRDLGLVVNDLTVDNDFYAAKAARFDAAFAAKGIAIHPADGAPERADVVVKELQVMVTGEPVAAPPTGPRPEVVVATKLDRYRLGEPIEVVYGASRGGWMHLYVVDPDGTYRPVLHDQVREGRMERVTVPAWAPYGLHTLVAVYSPGEQLSVEQLADSVRGAQQGVQPRDSSLVTMAKRLQVSP